MASQITVANAVDPILVQQAGYQLDGPQRQYIDDQIRGCQIQLVNNLLSGLNGTWFTLDGGSAGVQPGDLVCSASNGSFDSRGVGTVTKATAGALTNAGSVSGVVLAGAAPGGFVRVAIDGLLSPTVTGLVPAAAGPVRANANRCQQVGSIGAGDYPVGIVDTQGYLTLAIGPKGLGSGGAGGSSAVSVQYATGAAPAITIPSSSSMQAASYHTVTSAGTCTLPASPTAGQLVYVIDEDGTTVSQGIVIQGNGNNIKAFGAGVANYTFSTAANGYAAESVLQLVWLVSSASFWKVM